MNAIFVYFIKIISFLNAEKNTTVLANLGHISGL